MSAETSSEVDFSSDVDSLRTYFTSGATLSEEWREKQLNGLLAMIEKHRAEIIEALTKDLMPASGAELLEIMTSLSELNDLKKNFKTWMKPRKASVSWAAYPASGYIKPDPLGVVLIIGAWNYPVSLTIFPLAAALAAGNCAVVKPSELSSHVSKLLAELLPRFVDTKAVKVIEGAVKETSALLKLKWDHIFYTGGGVVGRIVMRAAAEHLTPVTLELGGKSPCIVDSSCDLDKAARRIVWGKFTNTGQTCIAPDYVMIEKSIMPTMLEKMRQCVLDFWGEKPIESKDFGRIINENHHKRLQKLLDTANGKVIVGGDHDLSQRYIAPTIIEMNDWNTPIMQEEIFGPLMPVFAIDNVGEAIKYINAHDKPLALYLFSTNSDAKEKVLSLTSSGGVVVNDCNLHYTCPQLPFGGVGASGMGAYHGQHGFDTFSHLKAVLEKSNFLDPALRYPPYNESKIKWLGRLV